MLEAAPQIGGMYVHHVRKSTYTAFCNVPVPDENQIGGWASSAQQVDESTERSAVHLVRADGLLSHVLTQQVSRGTVEEEVSRGTREKWQVGEPCGELTGGLRLRCDLFLLFQSLKTIFFVNNDKSQKKIKKKRSKQSAQV